MIRKDILEKIPEWYKNECQYDLCLTDDIDSLLSCTLLNHLKGWNIEQVMLFKHLKKYDILYDILGVTENNTKEVVSCDYARMQGKTFDNHVSRFSEKDYYNKECINPNLFAHSVTSRNYYEKYAGSTVLVIYALYDLTLEIEEELMMILLAIDSTYKGYYDLRYQKWCKYYINDALGLDKFYECITRNKQEDFEQIARKYRLTDKITFNNGFLETSIDIDGINSILMRNLGFKIELPKYKFVEVEKYIDTCNSYIPLNINEKIHSMALTRKNTVNFSKKVLTP